MSKLGTADLDLTQRGTGALSSAASGTAVPLRSGTYNLTIWGTFVATLVVEYSFDAQVTWVAATTLDGVPASFTSPISVVGDQPEANTYARVRCSSYTSGTANWRIGY